MNLQLEIVKRINVAAQYTNVRIEEKTNSLEYFSDIGDLILAIAIDGEGRLSDKTNQRRRLKNRSLSNFI